MKRDAANADREFDCRVGTQRIRDSVCIPAAYRGADRHPADKHDQHDRLRVRRMTKKELQVVRPDRFVDEAARPGKDKDRLQQ